MFIYASTLRGNVKFSLNRTNPSKLILLTFTALIPVIPLTHNSTLFRCLYSYSHTALSSALALILILRLIISVKIIESFKGALIKFYS